MAESQEGSQVTPSEARSMAERCIRDICAIEPPDARASADLITALLLSVSSSAEERSREECALWCREYADIVAGQALLKATPFEIAMACSDRIKAIGSAKPGEGKESPHA